MIAAARLMRSNSFGALDNPQGIEQPPGVDDPAGTHTLLGASQASRPERVDDQALRRRLGPKPKVHLVGLGEQLGKMLGERVVTIRRIGTEYLASPFRPKALSAPALLLGMPRPYEEYEIAVLTVGAKHGHGLGLRHAGEIEEVAVRPVSAIG